MLTCLGTERVWLAPSCSLLHVPFSLGFEQKLNPEIKSWLAFAEEKLIELAEIRRAYEGEIELAAKNRSLLDARATSALIHREGIKSGSEKIGESDFKRRSPTPSATRLNGNISGFPIYRPQPSVPFPRPRTSGQHVHTIEKAKLPRLTTKRFWKKRRHV